MALCKCKPYKCSLSAFRNNARKKILHYQLIYASFFLSNKRIYFVLIIRLVIKSLILLVIIYKKDKSWKTSLLIG